MNFDNPSTRTRYFVFSALLVGLSIVFISLWGLRLGIDFMGGSLFEIKFTEKQVALKELQNVLAQSELPGSTAQPTEKSSFLIRAPHMDELSYESFVDNLERELGTLSVERFETIGPVIGEELRKRTLQALVLGIIGIIIYIAWAFRRVSRPVPSWQYGMAAIIALVHDVVITIGVFAALGHWLGIEVGAPFVAALLTILGYSVNDTIVVFDRVREHLLDKEQARRLNFGQLVSVASRQSVTRSVNVSLTTLLVLLAVFIFGGSTTQYFVLALIIGVTIGTYSSLFLASPLLVVFASKRRA